MLRFAAEKGVVEAQLDLGNALAEGDVFQQNYIEAAKWLEKAARQGNAEAGNKLGILYLQGRGVPLDKELAFTWFRLAAEAGSDDAMFNLGNRYLKGDGAPKDLAKAFQWHERAAELGYADSQLMIGCMYADGLGVEKNRDLALEWLWRAAAQEHPDAPAVIAKLTAPPGGGTAETPPDKSANVIADPTVPGGEEIAITGMTPQELVGLYTANPEAADARLKGQRVILYDDAGMDVTMSSDGKQAVIRVPNAKFRIVCNLAGDSSYATGASLWGVCGGRSPMLGAIVINEGIFPPPPPRRE